MLCCQRNQPLELAGVYFVLEAIAEQETHHLDAFPKRLSRLATSIYVLQLVGFPMIHRHLETKPSQLLFDLNRSQLVL